MYRLLFTVILMTPFLVQRMEEFRRINRRDWGLLFVSGLFLGLHFLFWIGSLKLTTVASSMILTALQPVFVMAGAYMWFGERVSGAGILAVCIAILGTVLIAWGDLGTSWPAIHGDILSILGTAAVSVYMLTGQSLRLRMSSFLYNYLVFLIATLVFAAYNLLEGYAWFRYSGKEWGIFLLLSIVPTVFGHALFNWLLKYVNAATISMSILGEPVGAILLAYLLLHDSVQWFQAFGGILTILGVWLFLKTKSGQASVPAQKPSAQNSSV
jgi:drug/metabolite transporter (DMT)-like permease